MEDIITLEEQRRLIDFVINSSPMKYGIYKYKCTPFNTIAYSISPIPENEFYRFGITKNIVSE